MSDIGALIDESEAQRAMRDALGVAVDVTSPQAGDLAAREPSGPEPAVARANPESETR